MNYRYEIPSNTNFRNYTVDAEVTDLDPDGFTADEEAGDCLCYEILEDAELVSSVEWEDAGESQRLLYWESREDAENDDGANALGQILKTPAE